MKNKHLVVLYSRLSNWLPNQSLQWHMDNRAWICSNVPRRHHRAASVAGRRMRSGKRLGLFGGGRGATRDIECDRLVGDEGLFGRPIVTGFHDTVFCKHRDIVVNGCVTPIKLVGRALILVAEAPISDSNSSSRRSVRSCRISSVVSKETTASAWFLASAARAAARASPKACSREGVS